MPGVRDIKSAYWWSITKLAEASEMDRATIRKRLKAAGVEPVTKDGASPLYRFKEACEAIYGDHFQSGAGTDPDSLDPQSRRAWYQSENERLKFEADQGHLIPDHEVAKQYSLLVKAISNGLDSLPDELERECGLSAEALEMITTKIDAMREQTYIEAAE